MMTSVKIQKIYMIPAILMVLIAGVGCTLVIESPAQVSAALTREADSASEVVVKDGTDQNQTKENTGKAKPSAEVLEPAVLTPTVVSTLTLPMETVVLTDSVAMTATTTAAVDPFSTPTLTPTPVIFTYVVQPGDTLNAIAARFDSSAHIIADFNHLASPNVLWPGQILLIPQGAVTPEPVFGTPTATPTVNLTVLPTATRTPTAAPTATATSSITPTATSTAAPTSTSLPVSLVGKIMLNDDCANSNWIISASGDSYFLLMPDDLSITFDPEKESYPAMVTGTRTSACGGKLVIVETLNWLVTATPTATKTSTGTPTSTQTPTGTPTPTGTTVVVATVAATAAAQTATATTQAATATAAAAATATAQSIPGAVSTATAAAALTATAEAAIK